MGEFWNCPILEKRTRSTQEIADTIELWLFETLADWGNLPENGV